MLKPHWQGGTRNRNTYQSTRVLGRLFDLLSETGMKSFDPNEIEHEMNIHVREVIEKALKKDPAEVEKTREDMRECLARYNKDLAVQIASLDDVDNVGVGRSSQRKKSLLKQYRLEIEKGYDEDDLPRVFSILYEQAYFKSRSRMFDYGKGPYIFPWEVAHDHLSRIIADGDWKKRGGIGYARTSARGNERKLFGRNTR